MPIQKQVQGSILTPRLLRLVVLLPIWIGLTLFVRGSVYSIYDDSYIFFRYADHLAQGCGFRFNCDGDPVEGYSSLLYLLLLAAARMFTEDLPTVSQVIGTVCTGAGLSLVVASAWSPVWARPAWVRWGVAGLASCIFALDHVLLVNAVVGMETALAAAIVAWWWWALVHQRFTLMSWVLPLAVLVRPECVLLLVISPLHPRARNWRLWGPGAIALVLLLLHRWFTFHALLPNTYYAKAGGTWRHFELGLAFILDLLRNEPLVALAPLALLCAAQRRVVSVFLIVVGIWFGFFLRSGGDTFLYHRLAIPLVPPMIVAGLHGLAELGLRIQGRLQPSALATALPRVLVFATALIVPWGWNDHRFTPTHDLANVTRWEQVGRFLRKHHPGETVAAVPIGAIGYYSDNPLIDLVGLTEPAIARAGRSVPVHLLKMNWLGHERHNVEWVLQQKPDIIVMARWRNTPFREAGKSVAGFWAEWTLLQEILRGRAPYTLYSPQIAPGAYWLMFKRLPESQSGLTPE